MSFNFLGFLNFFLPYIFSVIIFGYIILISHFHAYLWNISSLEVGGGGGSPSKRYIHYSTLPTAQSSFPKHNINPGLKREDMCRTELHESHTISSSLDWWKKLQQLILEPTAWTLPPWWVKFVSTTGFHMWLYTRCQRYLPTRKCICACPSNCPAPPPPPPFK